MKDNKKRFKLPSKRLVITALITFTTLIIILFPLFFKNVQLVDANSNKLDIILNISQIVSAIFVIVGTFIAVWQYYLSSKSNIIKLKTDKVQKAIDLSKYYKDEILKPYSFLKRVYVKSGIIDVLSKEKHKMNMFDDDELHDIFSNKEINNLEKRFNSQEYLDAIVELNYMYNLNLNGCKIIEIVSEDGTKKESLKVDRQMVISNFYSTYIVPVLNNIEHFAMYFTHNVADESVIYQSLYPTYLEMCRAFYYNIASCSKSGKPKLYRNLQKLYAIWNERDVSSKTEIRKQEVQNGTVVDELN